ncbi:leucine-rich repeat and immunoglobulin-like domain-containing nogo receptor-interacting protein 2 isoform X1 [Lineus longissimus]|uniref:leucine-rich repeat and immunoglobulin-like domain-containing nogo receptor-interacting protein 2 isoform X1 n=1 Tax=Lineus longissimus TaxID=88925 RepID=UPI00315CA964
MANKVQIFCKLAGFCVIIYRLAYFCMATNPDELERLKLKGCHFHERSRSKLTCSGLYHSMSISRLWIVLSYLSCHYTMLGFYLENGNLTNMTTNIFIHMKDLDELSIKSSGIVNIDKSSFNGLKMLRTLNLIGNEIPLVPQDLNETLPMLRYLYLDNNEITRIYKTSFQGYPADLQIISIGYNKIKVIENGAFSSLRKLKEIQLRGNRLKRITDKTFRFQTDLLILDISFNIGIELKSGCFSSLTELRTLNLRNCWPNGIPKDQELFLAQGLEWTVIEKLDLGHNKIASLNDYGFRPFGAKLKLLDLEFCSLEKLEDNVFAQFVNVETLFLRNNQITIIEDNAFTGLFSLRTINLERNHLVSISENVFRVLGDNVHVALEGNPWSCSCMMATLQSWIIANQPNLNVTCKSPTELNGRNLKDVTHSSLYCTKPELWQCCRTPIMSTVGATVFVECAATGIPLPIVECFPRKGNPLPRNQTYEAKSYGETLAVNKIWVKDVTTRNSGMFECLATSSQGQASKQCSIKVIETALPVKQKGGAGCQRHTLFSFTVIVTLVFIM